MIIGISGKMGSGKNTVASIIQYLTTRPDMSYSSFLLLNKYEQEQKWQQKSFAHKLKKIASIITNTPSELFENQEFKESYLNSEWDYNIEDDGEAVSTRMTVREFLQKLGTEAMRQGLHPNTWINALFSDYRPAKFSEYYPSKWIITDLRFINEYKAIKERKGIVIKVIRDQVSKSEHISETELDYEKFDYIIHNNADIEDLIYEVKVMLKRLNYD